MRAPKILHASDLDPMKCASPDCDHPGGHSELYFAQRCHPGASLEARYVKQDQTLVLSCEACETTVAVLKVAP